tara:strand:- start:1702 stop:2001 length:300 start_codon:yes stop_codon:yes gene_type:complete
MDNTHTSSDQTHPSATTYVTVAATLSIITAIEVGIFYLTWLSYGIIPILVILSGAKFALVAMFYMHLKYDARLFTTFFVGGFVLATLVIFALLVLFRFF